MKTFIQLLTIILVFSNCKKQEANEFSLTGKTGSIENGTFVYFSNNKGIIDSAIVNNNTFVFNTKSLTFPLRVVLRKDDFSQYRFMWLEENAMTFDATNSDFKNATVTGSAIEDLRFKFYQSIDSIPFNEREPFEIEFIENHPNSIISASMLSVYSTKWGKETTSELFEKFSEENKNSKYGQQIATFIRLNKNPNIGDQFVDFEMKDQNGELKNLSDLKGKTILLEFWASWCGPCRKENPNLIKTYKKFSSKGFEIFAVSIDENKESWLQAIKTDSLNWYHVNDLKGKENEAQLIYGISSIPDNFLINEQGEIIARNLRGEKLNEKLEEVL